MSSFLATLLRYSTALLISVVSALLATLLESLIAPDHPGHIGIPVFWVSLITTAIFCPLGPSLVAAALSCAMVDYLFIPPLNSVDLGWNDVPLLASFLLAVAIVEKLKKRHRQAEKILNGSKEKMRIAQSIQQKLLPVSAPVLSEFDIAGASHSAEATGGDYFDYIPMRDGSLGIVLGDVSGHGFGSALLMAEIRAYLRALVLTHNDVGEILTLTNRIFSEDTEEERFMTLFFVRLNPHNGSFIYASAGHEAYLFSASEPPRKLHSTSLPLGLDRDLVVPSAPVSALVPGEILLLITDGFSEAQTGAGRPIGISHILELVQANHDKTAREIIEALCMATRTLSRCENQDDDMTAVIVKRKATTGPSPISG
jgi:serine phosphatase RsbU (regulator of sigma subunit)